MHVKLELSYKLSEKPLQFPPQFPIIKSNKKNQKRNIMKKEYRELKIKSVKYFKQYAILKFKGIDNINDIEKYKGKSLFVTRENAQPLGEDEYYIADLIGMEVYLEDGSHFGTLKDVMETGANDVYIIKTEEGKEVLIPAIYECILDVNVEAGKMEIHLLDGLV